MRKRSQHLLWAAAVLVSWCGVADGQAPKAGLDEAGREDLEQRPAVQFNLSGHTSAITSMAFSSDSQWLISGGLDRIAHVWLLKTPRALGVTLACNHIDALRWQIARGDRGSISAVSVHGEWVAIGGIGASGAIGEISVFDWRRNQLLRTLRGHQTDIAAIAFSPDGKFCASLDLAGRCVLWNSQDAWRGRVVCPASEDIRRLLAPLARNREATLPLTWEGSEHLVIPRTADQESWTLQRFRVSGGPGAPLGRISRLWPFTGVVATADGMTMASVTADGFLEVFRQGRVVGTLKLPDHIRSLAMHPSGRLAVAGTYLPEKAPSYLLGIGLLDDHVRVRWKLEGDNQAIRACVFSPDGTMLAYGAAGPRSLIVRKVETDGTLRQELYMARRTAWLPQQAVFDGIQLKVVANNAAFVFDTKRLALDSVDEASPQPAAGLEAAGQITIELDNGMFCSADRQTHDIVIYQKTSSGPTEVRRFRGHHDGVLALTVSADKRYIVSTSADGTVRWWSLGALDRGAGFRWGGTLQVVEGRLQVADLEPAGLLYREGIRNGDTITRIRFDLDSPPVERAEEIRQRLEGCDGNTAVEWEIAGRKFIRKPAWSEVCSLLATTAGEWVFWTPEGYYTASTEGNRLVGWQVRRGTQKQPLYFRADQVRHALERPQLMSRLLESGSLDATLRVSANDAADPPDTLEEIAGRVPSVRIETTPDELARMASDLTVRCRVDLPVETSLPRENVRIFANGVLGRVVDLHQTGPSVFVTAEVALPADNLVDVLVRAWWEDHFGEATIRLDREVVPPPTRRTVYSFLAGANEYEHMARLEFCLNDVHAVERALREHEGFDRLAVPIVSSNFNKDSFQRDWKSFVAQTSAAALEPDDVIVIFVSAHGDGNEREYYLAGVDARMADSDFKAAGSADEETLIRLDELLADLAHFHCRKIVLLDTCRAGALLPAIRALQEDLLLVVTSCREAENSIECEGGPELGYFTHSLVRGLQGGADRNGDGIILLAEVCEFVAQDVPREQLRVIGRAIQHPQYSPQELIQNAQIMLAK